MSSCTHFAVLCLLLLAIKFDTESKIRKREIEGKDGTKRLIEDNYFIFFSKELEEDPLSPALRD